jgi:geranylgeranyl pyrophosphate synthase
LDEGKFSLTLIHALENAAETDYNILQHLMAQRHVSSGMSLAQKHLVLDLLKATGSLEYTVATLRKISKEIDVEVDSIESVTGIENRSLRTLLDLLKV